MDSLLSLIENGVKFSSENGDFSMILELEDRRGEKDHICKAQYEFLSKLVKTGKTEFSREELKGLTTHLDLILLDLEHLEPGYLTKDGNIYKLNKDRMADVGFVSYYCADGRTKELSTKERNIHVCPRCGYKTNENQ